MPDYILDTTKRNELDSNIREMLKAGATQDDVVKYASDFGGMFGKKKDGSTASPVSPSPFVSESPSQKKARHTQTFQSDAQSLEANYKTGLDQAFKQRDQFGGIDMFGVSQFQQSREGKAGKIVSDFQSNGTATKEDVKYLNTIAPKAAAQIVFSGTPEPVKQKIQKTGKVDDADIDSFTQNHKQIVGDNVLATTGKFYSDQNKKLVSTLTNIPGFEPSMVSDPKYLNNFYKSITASKTKELAALDAEFPEKVIPSGVASITVRENGKEYEARLKDIDARYAKTYDAFGRLAASKIATPDRDPLEIGLEYLKFADPIKYSVRVKAGSSGIDRDIAAVGSQLQYANTSDLRQLKNVKSVGDNLDTRFPDKLIAETRRRLGAELYKGDNWFLNFSPSVEELDKAAAQLPEKNKEAYFKYVREEESKIIGTNIPQSGALNQLGMGMMSTVEGTNNYLASKVGARGENNIAKDALNAPNKTRFEAAGAGQAEMARIKELNNKVKSGSTLTVDELEEKRDLESFTNIRSTGQKVIDGSFNLAGQVLFQALGTKGLAGLGSAVVKGAGLLKTAMPVGLATEEAIASSAMNFGISQSQIANIAGAMVAYSSSYDGAAQEAIQLFPDDNNKRAIYTTAVAGLNAVTERIFKDEKILDAFKRTVRPNIGNLVNEIAAGRLTKELLQPTLTKIINDGFKIVGLSTIENVKETTEEVATSVGTSLTKLLLAPEKFNYSEAVDDAVTTATTMFTDGGLVALVAGVKGYRQNKVGIGVLSKLGVDKTFTADVKSVINTQVLSGNLSKEEAAKKINVINKIIETNTVDMPRVKALAKISETASKKYAIALSHEKLLKQEMDATTDEALKSKIQEDIKASESIRKSILNKEVFIDDNYAVVTPQEAANSAQELSNIEILSPEQIQITGDSTEFANQMESAQGSLGRVGMSVSPYAQEEYDSIAAKGGKFLRAAGNKILALLKPNGEMVSLVKDATVKTKGAAQAMISRMKDMGGLFMDNYDIYLTPIYEKAGYRVAARVPFNEEYAPEGWDAEDSPLKNKPDVVFMVRNDFAPEQAQSFTDYEQAQNYTQGLVDNAVAQGIAKLPAQAGAIDTALGQAIPKATKSLEKAGIKFQVVDGATDRVGAMAARGNQALFLSDDGTIIIDRSKLQNDIEAGLVVWHEASHPVMNIIRNTNKPLYDAVVRGINEAAKNNKGVADALNWAQSQEQYDNADTQNDEAIVETIGRINSGLIDVSTLDTGLRQQIIDFVNSIAKFFGIDPILNDTDLAAFKKTVSQVADALKAGRDISEVVGQENVGKFKNDLVQQRITAEEVLKKEERGDKKVIEVADAFEKAVDDVLDPQSDPKSRITRFLKNAYEDLRYFLSEYSGDTGLDWYTNKVKEFEAKLKDASDIAIRNGEMPEANSLRNPDNMDVFKVVLALSSIGVNPRENVKSAFSIWKTFNQETKIFSKYQPGLVSLRTNIPDGKGGYSAPSGEIIKDTAKYLDLKQKNGKVLRIKKSDLAKEFSVTYNNDKGKEVTKNLRYVRQTKNAIVYRSGPSTVVIKNDDILDASEVSDGIQGKGWTTKGNIVAINLVRLENVLADHSDLNSAINWINDKHPINELRKYNSGVPDVDGAKGKINPKGERLGSYIIGEKLGAFHQNVAGTPTELTMDLWWSRTWNRYMGTLIGKDKDGEPIIQETPRTDNERNVMREAAKTMADSLGLEVHELQAALWYLEQQVYKRMGAAVESYSFVDGINQLLLGYGKSTEEIQPDRYGIDSSEADQRRTDAAARAANILYGEGGREGQEGAVKKGRDQSSVGNRNLAPNGKPSKLNDKQYQQVRTAEFKNWFGDWENDPTNSSKVVDENGEPMVYYHGTNSQDGFDKFTLGDGKRQYIFFSPSTYFASEYGGAMNGKVFPVFLNSRNIFNPSELSKESREQIFDIAEKSFLKTLGWMNNPEDAAYDQAFNFVRNLVDAREDNWLYVESDSIRDFIKDNKYDAVYVRETGVDNIGVVNPNQIKSAIGNSGAFSTEDNRIQASVGNRDIINGFYSPIEDRINTFKQPKASVQKWKEIVGVKSDEAVFSGLSDWLGEMKPDRQLSKEDVSKFIKDNRIEIKEIVKSDEKFSFSDEKLKEMNTLLKENDLLGFDNIAQARETIRDDADFANNMGIENQRLIDLGNEYRDSVSDYRKEATEFNRPDLILPGGENYREILITTPVKYKYPTKDFTVQSRRDTIGDKANYRVLDEAEKYFVVEGPRGSRMPVDKGYNIKTKEDAIGFAIESNLEYTSEDQWDFIDKDGKYFNTEFQPTKEDAVRNFMDNNKTEKGSFKSSHFKERNIITHLRMNTRTDVDGKKVLFLEEVQSDWGQKGKKEGFKKSKAEVESEFNDADKKLDALNEKFNIKYGEDFSPDMLTPEEYSNYSSAATKRARLGSQLDSGRLDGISPAPYVTNTNAWVKLGLKVALKEAVKQGADRIAWTTGDQQNERYDLSKKVDEIKVLPQYGGEKMTYAIQGFKDGDMFASHSANTISELEGIVGKDIASKVAEKGEYEGELSFKGKDLQVGGKGMKAFYGDANNTGIVGNVAKALVKELTGKEGTIVASKINDDSAQKNRAIETARSNDMLSNDQRQGLIANLESSPSTSSIQPAIDITPELAQSVQQGMPQFSVGNRSEDDLRAPGTGKERDRALSSRFGSLDPETQAKIEDDATTYFQKTNKQTSKAVEEFIDGQNLIDMADYVLSKPDIPEVSKVWMAAEVAKRLNAEIAAAKSAGDQQLVDALIDKQSAIYNDFAKQATSLGQAVQAFIAFKSDPNAVDFFLPNILKQLKKAGVENVTDVQKVDIVNLLRDVNSAADGLPKDKAIIKLSHYLAGIAPMKPMDVLQALWYAKILSGITTQSTNFFANVFNTAFELPAVAARIAIMNMAPLSLAAGVKGFGSGIVKGAVAAADIMKTGVRSKEVDKYFAESPLEYFTWSKWLGKTGNAMDYIPPINFGAWKFIGRMLAATDALFSTANQEAIANMLAYAEAAGTPGNNNFKKANAILGNTKQNIDNAKAQATAEGFDPKSLQGKRRVIEIVAQGRKGTDEADAIGKRITMNYNPEGWTKPLFDATVALQRSFPIIKMVVPFARIVANLTENGLNYSPLGLVRAVTGKRNPIFDNSGDKLSTEERVDLFNKFAMGMTALVVLAAKTGEDDEDWFEITAGGSNDVQKKYELQKGGWRPYTITMKDGTKINYKDWPIAGILSGIGHIRDAKKYSFDDSTQMGLYATGFFQNFYDKSLLSGLQDFFGIFNVEAGRGKYAPDTKMSDRAKKYAAQQVRSVAVSNLAQQTGKMYSELVTGDPQRDAKTFAEVIYRDLPMFNDGIRPIIDVFGDDVKYNTTERLTPKFSVESDDMIKWLNENKLFVGVPQKKNIIVGDGSERPMTDEEYYEYRKLAGKETKTMINEFMEGIKYPDQEIKEKMFDAAKSTARKIAYITILEKYGLK